MEGLFRKAIIPIPINDIPIPIKYQFNNTNEIPIQFELNFASSHFPFSEKPSLSGMFTKK